MAYTAAMPPLPETTEQLRAPVPGWGVDLDPVDRPSSPKQTLREDARAQPRVQPRGLWSYPRS